MLNRCLNGHCGNNKQGEGPTSRLPTAGIVKYRAVPLTALIPIPFCMTTDQCVADPAVPCPAAIRTLILAAAPNDDDAASIIISDDYRIILHRRD